MANRRIAKINELIKRELSQIILREIEISREALITVTKVDCSANLIQAKVWVSALPEEQMPKVLQILNRHIYEIQQMLNKRLNMRPIPKIKFIEEKQAVEAARIDEFLNQIKVEKEDKNC